MSSGIYILLSIYSSDALRCPPRGWPWQKRLHLSLSEHSIFACSKALPRVAPLSHIYSFTLSLHLFLYSLNPHFHSFTLSSQTPHSPSSQCVQTTATYFYSPIPPPHNSLNLHGFPYHTFHTLSLLSPSHLVTPHAPLR